MAILTALVVSFFNGTTALTWDNSQEFCHTHEESSLLEIFNEEQQDFINLMAEQIEIFSVVECNRWIGSTDVAKEPQQRHDSVSGTLDHFFQLCHPPTHLEKWG